MLTISSISTRTGGIELWRTLDGGYRLRTWHRNEDGTITAAAHSVSLSEKDVERLSDNIMDYFFEEDQFEEEHEDLIHSERTV
jgi:hypothetical protein